MFRTLLDQLILLLSNLSDLFEIIFRALFGGKQDRSGKRTFGERVLQIVLLPFSLVKLVFLLLWTLVTLPFPGFSQLPEDRRKNLLWGLPSILAFLGFTTIATIGLIDQASIEKRYRLQMNTAIKKENFTTAKLLCSRLMDSNLAIDSDTELTYANLLVKTGEPQRAEAIIKRLAPDDRVGDSKAHRIRAMQMGTEPAVHYSPDFLKRLRWHLQNSGPPTGELHQVWCAYYLAVGQNEQAAQSMEQAASSDPKLLIKLADIYINTGNPAGSQRALRESESIYSRKVASDPLNVESRVVLAATYIRQKKLPEAQGTLMEG